MTFWFLRQRSFSRASRMLLGTLFVVATTFGGPAGAEAVGTTVKVLYPDSLVHVMQQRIVPAFEQATNYRFTGRHAGSVTLTSEIRERAAAADILITASPQENLELMGSARGNWVDWYAAFMQSPLVLGYDPASKFADKLKSRPWYQVAAEPGFRLGLTNPYKDPKGRLTAMAIDRVVNNRRQPDLEQKLAANSQIVPTQDVIQRLHSHQLDAAFLYASKAAAAAIPTVPLGLGNISATYTVTILNNAPHPGAASAFVAFLLGQKGKQILENSSGLELTTSIPVFGNLDAVPTALKPLLNR